MIVKWRIPLGVKRDSDLLFCIVWLFAAVYVPNVWLGAFPACIIGVLIKKN